MKEGNREMSGNRRRKTIAGQLYAGGVNISVLQRLGYYFVSNVPDAEVEKVANQMPGDICIISAYDAHNTKMDGYSGIYCKNILHSAV